MMNTAFLTNRKIHIVLFFISVIISFAYWGNKKEGLFIDELYSYGLSNSYYAPYLDDLKDFSDGWAIYERNDIRDYLEVRENDEKFSFSSVYYNQTQDNSPPLFYMFLNAASSLFPNSHSKWIGLSLNLFIFLLLIWGLYSLCLRLFNNSDLSLFTCAMYVFSSIGMSTALLIRMYALLTLSTICLVILVLDLVSGKSSFRIYGGLALIVCMGMLTHYYFVLYTFFLSIAYLFWSIIRKQNIKGIALFIGSVIAGLVVMLIIFPSLINHLISDKVFSGTNAVSNFFDTGRWLSQAKGYSKEILHGSFVVLSFTLLHFFSVILLRKYIIFDKRKFVEVIILVLPAVFTLITVIIISPVIGTRYILNIFPILMLILPFLISLLLTVPKIAIGKFFMFIIVLLNMILPFSLTAFAPPHLYRGAEAIRCDISKNYAHSPCLYISKGVHQCMTADLLELLEFDNVFVSKTGFNENAYKYVSSSDSDYLILYVGTSDEWYEATDSKQVLDEILATGLYENPQMRSSSIGWLRESYLLKRRSLKVTQDCSD